MRLAIYLSVTYLALAAALGLMSGCSKSATGQDCFRISDCPGDSVCFLGTCKDQRYSIDRVYAELTPATAVQQMVAQFDTHGYQTVQLQPVLDVTGSVQTADTPPSGTLYATRSEIILGRTMVRSAAVDSTGAFDLKLVPGSYDMRFVPYSATTTAGTQPGLPPVSYGTDNFDSSVARVYPYPSQAALVTVTGRVRYSTVQSYIENALVSGTGRDQSGAPVASCDDITDPTGTYTLVFPPGTKSFDITVRPDGNSVVPEATVTVQPVATDPHTLADIVLDVSPFPVEATVVGPDQRPVAQAVVYFEGANIGSSKAKYVAQLTTDDAGSIGTATLLPGDYTITVMPARSAPYGVKTSTARLTPATVTGSLPLQVGLKVHISGRVTAYGGAPAVARATVTLSLRRTPASRQYTAQTDANGGYALDVDPGDYELVVEPPLGSAWPLYRVLLPLADSKELDVSLYAPTFAYGRVIDPDQVPVSGVRILFFSPTDFDDNGSPLRVGLAITDSKGEFVVPLPKPDGA